VLDVGCGTGAALAAAGEITGDVTGVDISPAMVERAREAVPGADLVVGDVAALPFEDATFDVVVSAFVVFFLDDPPAGLREWRRVLRPGGRIAMSTWNGPDERWSWERALRQEFAGEMPPELLPRIATQLERLARFDEPGKVKDELAAAGFEAPAVEPYILEFRFEDEQSWWDWSQSHAGRAAFDLLPAETVERYRARAFEEMQVCRADDGTFPRSYSALFATARRP
jgi:ubiquinone/menaquinone biosynthesis C-methylase UbiE